MNMLVICRGKKKEVESGRRVRSEAMQINGAVRRNILRRHGSEVILGRKKNNTAGPILMITFSNALLKKADRNGR